MCRLLGIATAAFLFAGSAFAFAPPHTLDPERVARNEITSRSGLQLVQVVICPPTGCRQFSNCRLDVSRSTVTCNVIRSKDGTCRQMVESRWVAVPCGKAKRRT